MSSSSNKRVRDILSHNEKPIFINPDASIADCLKTFKQNNVGFVIVSDNNETVTGVLTDRDVACRLADTANYENLRVKDCMYPTNDPNSNKLVIAKDDDDVRTVASKMSQAHVRRVPIVDKRGKAVGVLSLSDIAKVDPELAGNMLSNLSVPPSTANLEQPWSASSSSSPSRQQI